MVNIYIIEAFGLIMCGYIYTGFIDFMFKGKSLTDFTIFFTKQF